VTITDQGSCAFRTINFQRQAALFFVRSKGRMPENEIELADWLLEFNEVQTGMIGRLIEQYEEHVKLCTTQSLNKGEIR
jgi:hypothetical protein